MIHLNYYLLSVGLMFIGFFALLLSSLLRQRRYSKELRQSEAQYHSFFENSPISLWEEDFSEVKALINALREGGTKDFKTYFENHPETIAECAHKVKVVDVNKATLKLYNVDNKKDFLRDLSTVFGEEIHDAFRQELIAIASNKTSFESEDFNRTFTGEKKDIYLKWSVVPGHESDYSKILVSIIDVTERKHADQALRESEVRYRTFMDLANDAIFIADAETGLLLNANKKAQELVGYSLDEIRKMHQSDLHPREERARYQDLFVRRKLTGEGSRDDLTVVNRSGVKIPVEISASEMVIDGRSVLQGIFRDVTERNRAQEALRESEKRYRDLVENISEVYFVCDERGIVVYGSPNFFSETGFAPEEIIGKPVLHLIASEDRARVLEFYRARADDGTLDTTCEFRGKRKDGRLTWVEQSTRIIRDPLGKVKEFRNVVRDITGRKDAQNELVSREKRFRALIEESSDVIALVDRNGIIRYTGPSISKILGYTPEELVGRNTFNLIHPLDLNSIEQMLEEILRGPSKIARAEVRIKQKNGSWCWIEGVGKNLIDEPAVNAVVVNVRDITERRVAEEMLRQLPIRIINAQESERRRVARDLHDSVNQILSSVKFRMESVEEKVDRKDDALKKDIVNAKLSLEKVIQEVRRISRNLRPSELDDLGVIPAVRSMCEEFKEVTTIDVDLKFSHFPDKLPPEIEVTMYRIIQEALNNTAKHSGATRLTIHCAKDRSSLRLKIKDNGKGLDQHDLAVNAPKYSGMGLLNMKERAAYVGGSVSIRSSPREGTEISVQIPLSIRRTKKENT